MDTLIKDPSSSSLLWPQALQSIISIGTSFAKAAYGIFYELERMRLLQLVPLHSHFGTYIIILLPL